MPGVSDKGALIPSGVAGITGINCSHETVAMKPGPSQVSWAAALTDSAFSHWGNNLLILKGVGDFVSLNVNKGFVCQSEEAEWEPREEPHCGKGAWALLGTIFSFPSKSELKFTECGDPLGNTPLVPSFQSHSICQLKLGISVLASCAEVHQQLFLWASFPAKPGLCKMESAPSSEVQVILAVLFLEVPFPVEQLKRIHWQGKG